MTISCSKTICSVENVEVISVMLVNIVIYYMLYDMAVGLNSCVMDLFFIINFHIFCFTLITV